VADLNDGVLTGRYGPADVVRWYEGCRRRADLVSLLREHTRHSTASARLPPTALVDGGPRSATVIALDELFAIEIPGHVFLSSWRRTPSSRARSWPRWPGASTRWSSPPARNLRRRRQMVRRGRFPASPG
jgi:hypothetical protein